MRGLGKCLITSVLTSLILVGCGTSLRTVIAECSISLNDQNNMRTEPLVDCIKSTYNAKGRFPKRNDVKLYYVQLDQIARGVTEKLYSDQEGVTKIIETHTEMQKEAAAKRSARRAADDSPKNCISNRVGDQMYTNCY